MIQPQSVDSTTENAEHEKEKQARESHCEIERRRRVKMARFFNELCDMVPACSQLPRKPDKLTILRMASSHMKALRQQLNHCSNSVGTSSSSGTNTSSSSHDSAGYKPSFLTDLELKHLLLEAADGFLFVTECETGNIRYVSDAVMAVLNIAPSEWYSSNFFQLIHPKDREKVREQFCHDALTNNSNNNNNNQNQNNNSSNNCQGRVLDMKSGTVKKEAHSSSMKICMGSRRNFVCRLKMGNLSPPPNSDPQIAYCYGMTPTIYRERNRTPLGDTEHQTEIHHQQQQQQQHDSKNSYAVVHITGYTKNWPVSSASKNFNKKETNKSTSSGNGTTNETNQHVCCLVAIGRLQVAALPNVSDLKGDPSEFCVRSSIDGRLTFVDQRSTSILGLEPRESLGKELLDLIHPDDRSEMAKQLEQSFVNKTTTNYSCRLLCINENVCKRYRQQQQQQNNSPSTQCVEGGSCWLPMKIQSYAFTNPFNDEVMFIISNFTPVDRSVLVIDEQKSGTINTTTTTTTSSSHLNNSSTTNSQHHLQQLQQQQQQHNLHQMLFPNFAAATNFGSGNDFHNFSNPQSLLTNTNDSSITSITPTTTPTNNNNNSISDTNSQLLTGDQQQQQQQPFFPAAVAAAAAVVDANFYSDIVNKSPYIDQLLYQQNFQQYMAMALRDNMQLKTENENENYDVYSQLNNEQQQQQQQQQLLHNQQQQHYDQTSFLNSNNPLMAMMIQQQQQQQHLQSNQQQQQQQQIVSSSSTVLDNDKNNSIESSQTNQQQQQQQSLQNNADSYSINSEFNNHLMQYSFPQNQNFPSIFSSTSTNVNNELYTKQEPQQQQQQQSDSHQ
ncbi:hypothetical protein SNEBB_008892 [Seison nebaliae]|nr:hypothetical protein SNEBB_008892 [Seison nebaliae]